jgi:hypothetical protein
MDALHIQQIKNLLQVLDQKQELHLSDLKPLLTGAELKACQHRIKELQDDKAELPSAKDVLKGEDAAYWERAKKALRLRGRATKNPKLEKTASKAEEDASELFNELSVIEKANFYHISDEEYLERNATPPEYPIPEINGPDQHGLLTPKATALYEALENALGRLTPKEDGGISIEEQMEKGLQLRKRLKQGR